MPKFKSDRKNLMESKERSYNLKGDFTAGNHTDQYSKYCRMKENKYLQVMSFSLLSCTCERYLT